MSGSCRAPQNCFIHYGLEFPIQVTNQNTFQVGDTIWVSMDIPDTLPDKKNGGYVKLSNFDLFFNLDVSNIDDTIVTGAGAMNTFILIEDYSRVEQFTNGFIYTYLYTEQINNHKIMRVGMIPTKAGVYVGTISLPLLYADLEDENRLDVMREDCHENITLNRKIEVNLGDTNHHLVKGICQSTPDGRSLCVTDREHFRNNGGFAFRVVP